MTSPGGGTPSGMLNGYGGIAAWSQKTRGEYENEILSKVGASTEKVKLFGQSAAATDEKAMMAAQEAAAAAALAAANEQANIENATAIAEANLKIGTKADPESVPTDVPGWVTLNPVEDATFPRSDLVPMPTIVNGNTSNMNGSSDYHIHTHNASITWVDPVYTTALNRLDIGYINATRARIYNTLGVIVASGPVSGLANFRLHVFKMGRDENGRPTGALTRLWSSDPLQATFSSGAQDVRVNMPQDIVAAKGDWYAVVAHQTGSGTARGLLGKNTASVAAMSGVHPTRLGMNRGGESLIPNTLTPAQLDTSSTWIPWVCLGQTYGLIKVVFTDLFDRADASTIGANWAVYGIGMDIRSGVAQCRRINYGNFATRTDYTRAAYVPQLSTDSQSVSVKITGFDRSNSNIEENPRAQSALRANQDMTRYVAAGIRWGIIEVRAYTDANPGGVTKNSTTYTWNPGDVVELTATDDVNGVTTYVVRVNDAPILSWTDPTSETSRGTGHRRAGFETANIHRGAAFTYVHIPSVGINEWKARDL